MELLNLLIKPQKYLCMLCYKESNDNITNIYLDMEIEANFFDATLNVADMIKYLYPKFEITLTQVCTSCLDLTLKMYLTMRRNEHMKKILNIIIEYLNNEVNKKKKINLEDSRKFLLNINLNNILDSNKEKNYNSKYKNLPNFSAEYEVNQQNSTENYPSVEKQCPYCLKTLENNKSYKIHIKHHKRERKQKFYYCNECDYKSLCKTSIEGHKNKNHLNKRPYVCHLCFKSFYHKKNLTAHVESHAQVRNEICEICGERFLHKKNLDEHLKLHSGVCPYECEICGKKFVTSGRRLEHIKRIHLEKTEICLICDKKFSLSKELTRHIKTVHSTL